MIGDVDGSRVVLWLVIASVVVVWWMARRHPSGSPRLADVMLFAGPVWWIIGVAPVAVAGYESPRHVYLAAAGWGLTLGAIFDVVRSWRPATSWRYACTAAAVVAFLAMRRSSPVESASIATSQRYLMRPCKAFARRC